MFGRYSLFDIDRIEIAQQTEIVGVDGDINSKTHYWLDVYCSDGTYLTDLVLRN